MTDVVEIDKAIAAHGMWKMRLKAAIDSGQVEIPVATICADNQCAFGKWLYGATLGPADKATAHYQSVRGLHADFHKLAGKVAQLATAGRKLEAEKLMALGGDFTAVSSKLTAAMVAWKRAVA